MKEGFWKYSMADNCAVSCFANGHSNIADYGDGGARQQHCWSVGVHAAVYGFPCDGILDRFTHKIVVLQEMNTSSVVALTALSHTWSTISVV